MSLWQDKVRGDWRYKFSLLKRTYAGGGFATKGQARAAREERRKEVKSPTRRPTIGTAFSEVANQYLDWSKRKHVKKTYEYKAMVFRQFIANCGDISTDQITLGIVHAYLSTRPSNHNYNVHRKELSSLFNWSIKHLGEPRVNPCVDLDKMPEQKHKKEIPTYQEFLRLLAAAGSGERELLLILAYTMARIDEVLRLTWQDINFERKIVTLWTRKNTAGEWKERAIPINKDLESVLAVLWSKRKQEQWVFYNAKEGSRYNRRPKLMKSLCRRAGIKPYGFHAIRHFSSTYAHDMLKVPTGVLSGILGHEEKRTTEIYLHSIDEAAREAMERMEGIFMLADYACTPPRNVLDLHNKKCK
ncbi:MAG: site-specific integrase [Smithella sp.]|jgi:integrase